ncbi:MAG: NAD(P)-dependent oxidoreductase [Sneathiellales bacterium]|nr:NAD(P)-dependent oxidoreductase [Sneathiellales bacterium]
MKKILVTGGGGYIGSSVVDILIERGFHPVVFDTFFWGKEGIAFQDNKITVIEGDVRNSRDLIYALQETEGVIHLAGIVGAPACDKNPLAHYTTNVESTHTLVNCMTDPEIGLVRDLIFCSSCSVYGNVNGLFDKVDEGSQTMPLSSYADGKLRAESIIMEKAKQVPHFSPTILRLTTIFGWSLRPRLDLVTNLFVYKALKDKKITIHGDGMQYRSLIHVRDVARALVDALQAPRYVRDRQIFHVGEETNNVTVRDLAELVKKYLPETEIEYQQVEDSDRRDYRITCQKIKNRLNWQAEYSVEQGIQELIEKLQSGTIDLEGPQYRNNNFDYR